MTTRPSAILQHGVVAGTAGGLAEIGWVALYAGINGGDAAAVARGVTTAAGVSAILPAAPVALGITVHMALAVMLGLALTFAWDRLHSYHIAAVAGPYPFTLAALAGVWAINFFVILPIVSPAFVYMVPYAVSLTSKLLFGLAAAAALEWQMASGLHTAMRAPVRNSLSTSRINLRRNDD